MEIIGPLSHFRNTFNQREQIIFLFLWEGANPTSVWILPPASEWRDCMLRANCGEEMQKMCLLCCAILRWERHSVCLDVATLWWNWNKYRFYPTSLAGCKLIPKLKPGWYYWFLEWRTSHRRQLHHLTPPWYGTWVARPPPFALLAYTLRVMHVSTQLAARGVFPQTHATSTDALADRGQKHTL